MLQSHCTKTDDGRGKSENPLTKSVLRGIIVFMWDVFLDALVDSLKIFPFLFLIYVLLEAIESGRSAEKLQKLLTGRFAPAVGALAGIVPECGFSAMYAKLYENRLIATGTLLAIFLSASDEGLIVLLTGACRYGKACFWLRSSWSTVSPWDIL